MTAVTPSVDALAALEFHRDGIGQVRVADPKGRGTAAFVRLGADDAAAIQTCSCSPGRAKRKACPHLMALAALVDECHAAWGSRSWDALFRTTLWYRLAEHLFEADRQPCARVRLGVGRSGMALHGGGDDALIWSLAMSPATERLLDRCGAAPGVAPETSRARLLSHLQLLQLSAHERALHDAGMPANRHAFESSFWWRLAYHCVREYGTAGTFHPAVDEETATFVLTFRPPGDPPVPMALPKAAVASVLRELAAAFPEQADLQVRAIPLMSIFKISASTTLDLDVRPQVRLLQEDGHARYLEREDVERFRYGRLVYVRELGILAELERPQQERRFAPPVRMQLAASQVPRLLQELARAGDDAPVLVDTSEREIRILTEPDAIEVSPHEKTGSAYWSSVRYQFGDATVSLADVLRARADRLPFLPTPAGWVDVAAPAFAPLARLTAAAGSGGVDGDRVRLSPRDLLRLHGSSDAPLRVSPDEAVAALVQRLLDLKPAGAVDSPAGLTSPLRAYQKLGLDWLVFLYENELSGLLCDDMGLGKTHQVLSLLLTAVARGARDPFLVVCPTSVVTHWRDKLRAHAPSLALALYHGPEREIPANDGPGVFLTSYGVLRNDAPRLAAMRFSVAVFDEVQQLKNSGTLGYKAAERIDARMRLGLTGTPIENAVGELKSLVDLVLPGFLGTDREFADRFGAPTARESQPSHARLRRAIAPFILRRVKAAVLHELPDKTEDVRTCPLSPEQALLYREALAAKAGPLVQALRAEGQPVPYLHVFALLNRLKQICAHPALALRRTNAYTAHASGKWDAFTEILDESLGSGQKVIVFTQFLGMIDIFEQALRDRGVGFATLTGATRDRGHAIRRFDADDDCRVFLASLKAAGHGIDLVAGSVVVHYDRWWNAAREDQATDRAHRIGQKRAVQVFKLVAEGTLEQRISAMIDDKRRLMESVVQADDPTLAKTFTRDELLALLQTAPPA